MSIVHAVGRHGRANGSLTVLGPDGEQHSASWQEVHEQAGRIAALLLARGMHHGSRVGLIADTSVDLVAALQAVWLTGSAITVLPPGRRNPAADGGHLGRLRGMIDDGRLNLVILGDSVRYLQRPLATRTPTMDLSALARDARSSRPAAAAEVQGSDLAVLQYTSGSTREPRGVPVTHGQLAANLAAIKIATRHDQVHRCLLSWLPLYHDMGLIGCLALPMSCGCPLVLQSPVAFAERPISWLEAITRFRATATAAPNFAWALMGRLLPARATAAPPIRLDSLRLALSGGEPVDPAAMTAFLSAAARHGLDPAVFTCAYGLAEATLAVTVSPPGRGLRTDTVNPEALERRGAALPVVNGRPGRVLARLGGPVPGTRIRIAGGAGGHVLGERRVGHVEISGASVVDRYAGRPATTSEGWRRTGDLGYLADGELVVCGRADDVLFAAGRNVFPQDVEAAAGRVPGVHAGRAAAFGIPGDGGDRLAVAVESPAWAQETAVHAIRQAVNAAVAAEVGLSPRVVVVLAPGHLPRTTSGKLRRADTRLQYLSGHLGSAVSRPTDSRRT